MQILLYASFPQTRPKKLSVLFMEWGIPDNPNTLRRPLKNETARPPRWQAPCRTEAPAARKILFIPIIAQQKLPAKLPAPSRKQLPHSGAAGPAPQEMEKNEWPRAAYGANKNFSRGHIWNFLWKKSSRIFYEKNTTNDKNPASLWQRQPYGAFLLGIKIPQPTFVNCDIRSGRRPWWEQQGSNL